MTGFPAFPLKIAPQKAHFEVAQVEHRQYVENPVGGPKLHMTPLNRTAKSWPTASINWQLPQARFRGELSGAGGWFKGKPGSKLQSAPASGTPAPLAVPFTISRLKQNHGPLNHPKGRSPEKPDNQNSNNNTTYASRNGASVLGEPSRLVGVASTDEAGTNTWRPVHLSRRG